jgi:hypothetical protein
MIMRVCEIFNLAEKLRSFSHSSLRFLLRKFNFTLLSDIYGFGIQLIFAIALTTVSTNSQAQLGVIAGAATTGVVLDQLSSRAQDLIDSATQSGDYLLVRAGIEARIAIENAKLASIDVLNVAFDKVSGERHQFIASIDRTLADAKSGVLSATEALQKVQEGGQQISQVLDVQGNRSYVTRYSPSVVYERSNTSLQPTLLKIRGINLDDSSASLRFGGIALKPLNIGKQELIFELPSSTFKFKPNNTDIFKAKLIYSSIKPGFFNRLFGSKETIERDIAILVLPQTLAWFEFKPTLLSTTLDKKLVSLPLEQFRGVNADQSRAFAAEPGYKIDLSSLSFSQGEGGE